MTILEALKSKVKYPMVESFFEAILIERGLDGSREYTIEVAKSNNFKGTRADCLIGQLDCPQLQEGGVAISLTDKSNLITVANAIYAEIGEPLYGKSQPKVTILDW